MTVESNGGSSEYYQLKLRDGKQVECLDVIEALELDFAEGNILKALWRRSAWRRGVGKKGTSPDYDAQKIAFFASRLVGREDENGCSHKGPWIAGPDGVACMKCGVIVA